MTDVPRIRFWEGRARERALGITSIRVRLFAAIVAIGAGVAAVVVAILLVKGVLG